MLNGDDVQQTMEQGSAGIPPWLKWFFRITALVGFSLAVLILLSVIIEKFEVKIVIAVFVFLSVVIALFGIALFQLKRWTLPALVALVITQVVSLIFYLVQSGFSLSGGFVVAVCVLIFIASLTICGFKYKRVLSGRARKLWLQIPLVTLFLLPAILPILSVSFPDDAQLNDADLLLPKKEIVPKSQNAHFLLLSEEDLTQKEQQALTQVNRNFDQISSGEVDVSSISTELDTLAVFGGNYLKASEMPFYQCPSSVNNYGLDVRLCSLNRLRQSPLMTSRALAMLAQGETQKAIDNVLAPARLGQLLDRDDTFVIGHLVAVEMMKGSLLGLERIVKTSAISQNKALALLQELKGYTYDGAALTRSFKAEYLSGRATYLDGLLEDGTPFNYFWHPYHTLNIYAKANRLEIKVAQSSCGVEYQNAVKEVEPFFRSLSKTSRWDYILPNFIGKSMNRVSIGQLTSVRGKECDVNRLNEKIQRQLRSQIEKV